MFAFTLPSAETVFYWTQIALWVSVVAAGVKGAEWLWNHPIFQHRRRLVSALKEARRRVASLERDNREARFTIDSFDRSFKRLHDEVGELRGVVEDLTAKTRAQTVYIVTLLLHIDGGGGKDSIPQPPDDIREDVQEALRKARGFFHAGGD